MGIIVQKYGGTSVGDLSRIKKVAERIIESKKKGDNIVVVVSAMAGETDRLIALTNEIEGYSSGREYDILVSTGEQVSSSLLAMVLNNLGYVAKSFTGAQLPVLTDGSHGRARIISVGVDRIIREIEKGVLVVVAGFQGVTSNGDITTLGRGGSDTTAVALAASLDASVCEIYTDVEGIYTADPGICPDAKRLRKVSYDEMLEMASLGARVLQTRSVEFARKYGVPVMVKSSFKDSDGTLVTREDMDMEKVVVSGITYNKDEAKISIVRVPDKPGIARKLFEPLAREGINVDMIVQNISHDGFTDLTFTVPKVDYTRAFMLVKESGREISAQDVIGDTDIAKVSIVGAGMKSHAGVAAKTFETLSGEGVNIQMISTSEIKISCIVEEKHTRRAVIALHSAFGLGDDNTAEEEGRN